MAGPFPSMSDAVGLPQKARMVSATIPTTGPGEGAFFLSDGSGGLNAGEPYFVPPSNGAPVNMLEGVPNPAIDLAYTLVQGNTTGGSNIVLSNGTRIQSENSAVGVPGRPVLLSPGTTVDTDPGALVWGSAYASQTRGKGAVDLQFGRATATHIVGAGSSYSALVGGLNNEISAGISGVADQLAIIGGLGSTISGSLTTGSAIVGGLNNQITGNATVGGVQNSVIVGGENNLINTIGGITGEAGSDNCFIGGGSNNTLGMNTSGSACFGTYNSISGNANGGVSQYNAYDVFCAGQGNTIQSFSTSTDVSFAACFGLSNRIYGGDGSVAFGKNNIVGGSVLGNLASCALVGGANSTVYSSYTAVWGKNIYATNRSVASAGFGEGALLDSRWMLALGGGGSGGMVQACTYARSLTTASAASTNLSASSVNRINVQANRTFGFRITVTARQSAGAAGTVGDSAVWYITGCIKRDGSNNTVLVGVPTGTGTPSGFNDAGAALWTVSVTADDTNEALNVTVQGEANKTIQWCIGVVDAEIG
jgi:hypothetical protein